MPPVSAEVGLGAKPKVPLLLLKPLVTGMCPSVLLETSSQGPTTPAKDICVSNAAPTAGKIRAAAGGDQYGWIIGTTVLPEASGCGHHLLPWEVGRG